MNLRPLGYEPYDARLCRLGPSLAGMVTSVDRTDQISLRRLRLPRLVVSRRVRFTNRFTEQAIDLQVPWSGSGWREHSYGGFGGATHNSARIPSAASPIFTIHYQIGKSVSLPPPPADWLTCGFAGTLSVRDRDCPR